MKYTAAHWGAYEIDDKSLRPIADDPSPSRIGKGWQSAARDQNSRIRQPAIRAGWLEGDGGKNRCNDKYIEVSWEKAVITRSARSAAYQEKTMAMARFSEGPTDGPVPGVFTMPRASCGGS